MCDLCKVERKYPCGLIGTDEIAHAHYDIEMGRPTDADIQQRHEIDRRTSEMYRSLLRLCQTQPVVDLFYEKAGHGG